MAKLWFTDSKDPKGRRERNFPGTKHQSIKPRQEKETNSKLPAGCN